MAGVDTASDEDESLWNTAIHPYQFEPSTSESSDSSEEEDDDETKLQDTAWYSVMHAYYGTYQVFKSLGANVLVVLSCQHLRSAFAAKK